MEHYTTYDTILILLKDKKFKMKKGEETVEQQSTKGYVEQ
jgi:hypothetical protein